MAKPPAEARAEIEKRLSGKFGRARAQETKLLLAELPGYKNGPYADIRKELLAEIEAAGVRRRARHSDESFALRRKGFRQVAMVGFPNAGKSSLLNMLTGARSEVANYAFTTLQVHSGIARVGDARIELVDLPGIIEGASGNKGLGRRVLGVVRNMDAIAVILDSSDDPSGHLDSLLGEFKAVGVDKPMLVVLNKADLNAASVETPRLVVRTSAATGEGLEELKKALLSLLRLMTVRVKQPAGGDADPIVVEEGATVEDVLKKVGGKLAPRFLFAKVSGPSAKFEQQKTGLRHELADGDMVELHLKTV